MLARIKGFSLHTSDSTVLATMDNADTYGLDRLAPIKPAIASMVVSPDEALRADARCPRPQFKNRSSDAFLSST